MEGDREKEEPHAAAPFRARRWRRGGGEHGTVGRHAAAYSFSHRSSISRPNTSRENFVSAVRLSFFKSYRCRKGELVITSRMRPAEWLTKVPIGVVKPILSVRCRTERGRMPAPI